MTTVAGGYRHPPPSEHLIWLQLQKSSKTVDLATSYELCRQLHLAHGRSYYYATRFLPAERRRHVHALYGFARYADDLVDHLDLSWDLQRRRAALEAWSAEVLAALRSGRTGDPILVALLHTVAELGIDHRDLQAFLRSMAMDLEVVRYATYEDLYEYVYGSAAVIGSMMLPVLEPVHPHARDRAMDLGVAFQLTNFLRDLAEDYQRGRIYLPLEDLARFDVSEWDFRARHVSPRLRALLAFEVDRTRRLYRRAEDGWAMLPPASQPCIRIAHRLYAGILDSLEAADYQVFRVRAAVPARRKLGVALSEVTRRALDAARLRAIALAESSTANGCPTGRAARWPTLRGSATMAGEACPAGLTRPADGRGATFPAPRTMVMELERGYTPVGAQPFLRLDRSRSLGARPGTTEESE